MRRAYYSRVLALILTVGILCGTTACSAPTTAQTAPTESGTTDVTDQTIITGAAEENITVQTDATSETDRTVPTETQSPDTETEVSTSPQPTESMPTETPPESVPEETEASETEPLQTETTAPAEVVPIGLSASISGSFEVGDTLEISDFTVAVTMSDGSVLTDPTGWAAAPMMLDSTSNQITVTYETLSTVVSVSAKLGSINGMDVVKEAMKYLELTYVGGGNSLTTGTDCSGFTKLIFAKFGITLPRTPSAQNRCGTKITAEEAKPGDLLAVTYPEGAGYDGHAGIYMGDGMMISAYPDSGVCITSVTSDMDYLRIYDNDYAGTNDDAYFECLEYCISLGHTGEYITTYIYWSAGKAVIFGRSPMGEDVYLDICNVDAGYESLVEAWKKEHLAFGHYTMITCTEDYGTWDYSYWNGVWYTADEMNDLVNAGLISRTAAYAASEIYGAFWNSNAVLTTGLGEVVDLSTCPDAENNAVFAVPGDPDEGITYIREYDPTASYYCEKGHRWEMGKVDGNLVRTCFYCGYQLTYCSEVLDHEHEIEATYFYGGYFEDSYVKYYCLTCGYREEYVINGSKGADHDHDYSYLVATVEHTCIMDGYTIHECICGASYKENIVEAPGHAYGECQTVPATETADGYDYRVCMQCGYTRRENYVTYAADNEYCTFGLCR